MLPADDERAGCLWCTGCVTSSLLPIYPSNTNTNTTNNNNNKLSPSGLGGHQAGRQRPSQLWRGVDGFRVAGWPVQPAVPRTPQPDRSLLRPALWCQGADKAVNTHTRNRQ